MCEVYPLETVAIICYEFIRHLKALDKYEGWNFNSGNYLFTTDTK